MDRHPAAPLAAGLGPLLGREHELSHLAQLLRDGTRLVTLRGPGGIGKTALALHLAHAVRSEYDHVQFIDLTTLRDPAQVPSAVAATLPAPAQPTEPRRLIRDFAAQRRTLLILDNFEQLLPAAAHLGELLLDTATLQLVVTSRSALRLHDEHEFPVQPLALPERALHAAASPAVRLFVARAQALLPAFELSGRNTREVMRLCELLEGVPLALELAAARLRTYALPDLLTRLEHPLGVLKADFRDRPERLRSLRAAVQWSYDLLDEGDRAVFECCAVFQGSFTPEALVEVWGAEDVLDRAESLLEQSFLQRLETPQTRWRMLQPLRELAAEHLDRNPQAQTWRERHARHFLGRLEDHHRWWNDHLTDGRERLLPDYPNMRAGLVWATGHRRADLAYRYLGTIGAVWVPLGLLGREVPLMERVLALPAPDDGHVRLRALEVSAMCLGQVGQQQAHEARWREILALYRELGDVEGAAWAQAELAVAEHEAGRSARSWQMQQEVLREYEERGGDPAASRKQRVMVATALLGGSVNLLDLGQPEQALEYANQAHQRHQEAGNSVFEIKSRVYAGLALLELNRLPEAGTLLLACLHDAVLKGFRGVADDALLGLSFLAAGLEDWPETVQFAALSAGVTNERSQGWLDRRNRQHLARAREVLGEAAFQENWEAGARLLLPEAVELAERLARGQRQRSPQAQPACPANLTPREREVLKLVAEGHPDRRIARLLGISPGTASKHVGNLLDKLGLRNRVELARWAIEQGEFGSAG